MHNFVKYILLVSMFFLALCTPGSLSYAGHGALIKWNVGKIIVLSNGRYFFQSTGFLFSHDGVHFVITTGHTIENIERVFGKDSAILIQFPNMDKPMPCTLLFTEPSEDSAVLEVEYPDTEEMPQPDYESHLDIRKGYQVAIIGYSDMTYKRHNPIILLVDFLTAATLDFKSGKLGLLPRPRYSYGNVFLTKGGSPHPGMSGGPAVKADTLSLLGMIKSYGNSRQDRTISEMLGTDEFHIVVRLDKTINRIENMR